MYVPVWQVNKKAVYWKLWPVQNILSLFSLWWSVTMTNDFEFPHFPLLVPLALTNFHSVPNFQVRQIVIFKLKTMLTVVNLNRSLFAVFPHLFLYTLTPVIKPSAISKSAIVFLLGHEYACISVLVIHSWRTLAPTNIFSIRVINFRNLQWYFNLKAMTGYHYCGSPVSQSTAFTT